MATKMMPLDPTRVITLKANHDDDTHKYLIVSFADSTLVLSVSEGKITTVADSAGFQKSAPTVHAQLLEDGSMIQVTDTCVHHI